MPSIDGTSAFTLDASGAPPEPGDILHMTNVRGNPSYLVVGVRVVQRRKPMPTGTRRYALRVVRNPPPEDVDPDARHSDVHRWCRRPSECAVCSSWDRA